MVSVEGMPQGPDHPQVFTDGVFPVPRLVADGLRRELLRTSDGDWRRFHVLGTDIDDRLRSTRYDDAPPDIALPIEDGVDIVEFLARNAPGSETHEHFKNVLDAVIAQYQANGDSPG